MNIVFHPFQNKHVSLWQQWIEKPHVKDVWFIEGYETADYIYQKISGNGYDYPFVIYVDDTLIGYIFTLTAPLSQSSCRCFCIVCIPIADCVSRIVGICVHLFSRMR
jgi:hypothetical protein